jgi:hypothetical protein
VPYACTTYCDGAVAGGRIELGPQVESSDLDEKVLTTTPVRDSNPLIIWVESSGCIRHILPPYGEGVNSPDRRAVLGSAGRGGRGWLNGGELEG